MRRLVILSLGVCAATLLGFAAMRYGPEIVTKLKPTPERKVIEVYVWGGVADPLSADPKTYIGWRVVDIAADSCGNVSLTLEK